MYLQSNIVLGQLGFEKYVAFSTVTFAGKFSL